MKKAFANYKQKKADAKAAKAENKKAAESKKGQNVIAVPTTLRAAILLNGCGEKDGTDVIEVSSLLIALSQHLATEPVVQCHSFDSHW